MKPKIPCLPGFVPVIIDDHATEETSGMEECIFLNIPCEINWAVFGMMPVSVNSLSMLKGTPSSPTITVLRSSVIISVHYGDYPAGTCVFIPNKYKSSQFLNIVEVFDTYFSFGLDNNFCHLKILNNFCILLDDFER